MQRLIPAPAALFGALLLPALLVSSGAAQRMGSSAGHVASPVRTASPGFSSGAGTFAFRQSAHSSRFRRSSPYTSPYPSLPFSFFGDSFNPDDIYSTGYPVASQPPEFLLQAARALAGSPDRAGQAGSNREPSPAQPLMIELQDGKYVHVNGAAADGEALPLTLASNEAQPAKTKGSPSIGASQIVASAAHTLPAAVLIFRDRHREEVRDYAIADGKLYARGDYYTDGYWNKMIELANLDVPATLSANDSRGIKFVLPSSPNEVVTRP